VIFLTAKHSLSVIPVRGRGNAAMDTTTAPKSRRLNLFEGIALTALFHGLPTFATVVLILKIAGAREIVADPGGAAIFVALASVFYALIMPYLGSRYPRFFRNGYEPLFFDATLPFAEKIQRWRTQPTTSLQLLTTVTLLSLLAVGVVSVG
jgi:hypothetical protein